MAEVRLEKVSKSFGDLCAVDQLSLTIHNKECIVLLGPTGAGKTTTLRLIAGLEQPQQGKVFIDGEDVTSQAPAPARCGFCVSAVFALSSLFGL